MSTAEIINELPRLSPAQRHQISRKLSDLDAETGWSQQLAEMAADPHIQRELREIEREFAFAEADGLTHD